MAITGKQKRYLRGLAHNQRVIVTVGAKGLTDDLLRELNTALDHHELLKIRLPASSKARHQELLQSICSATDSELVQVIGHIGVIFRSADPPQISLPG
ncbi:MAG: YhbY family RNA-binding protein [Arenicellales bacterium]|nr:YhbY family RNA-binding protein [Arenicellales bacterium]